jgi:LysR family hydrogen peroxide-inducible transcriptional activator
MIRTSLRQLEYFEALAQTLHFGRAASLCSVTQPALSAQIAELEQGLGCRLFSRARGAVALTEEGRALLPRAISILDAARELESTARPNPPMQGRFRLGLIPTIAPYLLPPLLPALREAFPMFQLELREALTPQLTEALRRGEIEAFVAALPIDDRQLTALPLFDESFFLAVPASDPDFVAPPVPPDSPALERLMLLEEGHCLREQALAVCTQVRPVALKRFGATSLTTLMQMVANGLGVTLIPEMAVPSADAIAGLKVVPFADPAPLRSIALFTRRNSTRAADCSALAGHIQRMWSANPVL